jgi:hypothetical protein
MAARRTLVPSIRSLVPLRAALFAAGCALQFGDLFLTGDSSTHHNNVSMPRQAK